MRLSTWVLSGFLIISLFGPAAMATAGPSRQTLVYSEPFLNEVGAERDVYFTREFSSGAEETKFLKTRVPFKIGLSLPDYLSTFRASFPDFEVRQDGSMRAVYHIVSRKMVGQPTSLAAKKVTLAYDGSISLLPKALARASGLGLEFDDERIFASILYDWEIEVPGWLHFSAVNISLESVLTRYLPLSYMDRILWTARPNSFRGVSTIGIEFDGTVSQMGSAIDYRDEAAVKKQQDLFFSYGDGAFADGLVTEDNVARITSLLAKRITHHQGFQARWIMFYLARNEVLSALPTLLQFIDYQYTASPVYTERYPAMRALEEMGEPAATAALQALKSQKIPLRAELLIRVVIALHGPEKAKAEVALLMAGQPKRLQSLTAQSLQKALILVPSVGRFGAAVIPAT